VRLLCLRELALDAAQAHCILLLSTIAKAILRPARRVSRVRGGHMGGHRAAACAGMRRREGPGETRDRRIETMN
jgi:hypothetical protein